MSEIININKRLRQSFGEDLQGRPRFRVVFSADQYEKRHGSFEDFYGSIFVRSFEGVRTVAKYQESPPAFVLERLEWNQSAGEIVNTDVTYEPLHIFKDKHGTPLPPKWRFVEIFMRCLLMGPKRMAEEMILHSPASYKKDFEEILEIIKDNAPYTATMLGHGEAVVVPEINNAVNNRISDADENP